MAMVPTRRASSRRESAWRFRRDADAAGAFGAGRKVFRADAALGGFVDVVAGGVTHLRAKGNAYHGAWIEAPRTRYRRSGC